MKSGFLTNDELFLFGEGTFCRSYLKLGAHPDCEDGKNGYHFAIWAPGARSVHVAGSFNCWRYDEYAMLPESSGGVWHLFISGCRAGDIYKYVIETDEGELLYKADPYAFYAEVPPQTASRLSGGESYNWNDGGWMRRRESLSWRESPMNIYEVHALSWRRHDDGSLYSWRELAQSLVPYAAGMGYTHIELLPVMEHPFDGSWGYQITGYFAPTSRCGEPDDFKYFIDCCHQSGLGVILDWVPGHFCRDAHGLGRMNGHKLFEKSDHAQWGTYKFDFGRGEVKSFLISNALFWLDCFHADGLRVDGVTSMLYLNFGIEDEAKKQFNKNGGEENLEAIDFLRQLNLTVAENCPGALMIAEESTAWPLVTYPPDKGGLGFHFKWDMGWMNDTLRYMKTDFPYRSGAHELLTFSMVYTFNENFVLPLSHDEVVHGKCSLIKRMPGDYWRQFAGLRLLTLYQMCHPGAKLSFMGNEIAQFIEWRYYESIEWFLADKYDTHRKHREFVRAINLLYKAEPAFWQQCRGWQGFEWLDANDGAQAVLSFILHGAASDGDLIVVLNFLPESYDDFRVGVPEKGLYAELFNSDRADFGGSDKINPRPIQSQSIQWHGKKNSVSVRLGPIGGVILKKIKPRRAQAALL